jgi:hypothetical protein
MMKKSISIFGTLVFTSFILASCSSSVESDAVKLAEIQCKSYELFEKVGKGEAKLEESTSLLAEMELFNKEMKTKYASDEDKQKFEEACLKAVAVGCK